MAIQIASSAMLGLAPHTDLGASPTTYYWYPFTGLSFGPQQPVSPLPPEAGRSIVPRSHYKAGVWGQGAFNLIPRLDDDFGHVLLAAVGTAEDHADCQLHAAGPKYFTGSVTCTSGTPDTINATGIGVAGPSGPGFAVGDRIRLLGSALNTGVYTVSIVAANTLTISETTVVDEGPLAMRVVSYGSNVAAADAGSHVHVFRFGDSEETLPYLTARRVLPRSDVASYGAGWLGEQIADCRIGSTEISLPTTGPLSTSFDILGRVPTWEDDMSTGTGWSLATQTYDSDDAFALGVDDGSTVTLDGVELRATGCVVTLNNNLLPVDQSRIIGSPYPMDFPVLSRGASVRLTCLLEDYGLYQSLFANSQTLGSAWSSTPLRGNFRLRANSPSTFVPSGILAANPYAIELFNGESAQEDSVVWSLQGALQLAPQQPIILTLIGSLERNAAGGYITGLLQNNHSGAYAPYHV